MFLKKNYQVSFVFIAISVILIFGTMNSVSGDKENEKPIDVAINLLKMEKIDDAIPIFEDVLKDDPENLDALKNLSVAYYRSNMCQDALQMYDRILKISSDSSEIHYGKAVCYNQLGLPEKSLSSLENINEKYMNDNSVLLTKGNSYFLLKEFEKSAEIYEMVLEKNPEHKTANMNLLLLSTKLKDHELTKELLVKFLGDEPKRTSGCGASGCMGKIPFLVPIKDSELYSGTVQIQVRNSSDKLVAVVESDTITYTPHPIIEKVLSEKGTTSVLEKEGERVVVIKLEEKTEAVINDYFMDRVEFFYNDYSVFFAYNLAVPVESGDYIITEWIIEKPI